VELALIKVWLWLGIAACPLSVAWSNFSVELDQYVQFSLSVVPSSLHPQDPKWLLQVLRILGWLSRAYLTLQLLEVLCNSLLPLCNFQSTGVSQGRLRQLYLHILHSTHKAVIQHSFWLDAKIAVLG